MAPSTSLRLGGQVVWPPVVLAPMAGITNRSFRRLCREHAPSGIYVNEMVTARGLVERDATTWSMIRFGAEESPRSLQLYGTDAASVGGAVRLVREHDLADHVDLNFGCPVPKVTRKGGGAALPYKQALFGRIVSAAVEAAAGVLPVTVKMRIGIDDATPTYLQAGRIAEEAGVTWVALHARTAAQHYSGSADWSAIARLKERLRIPVLGNGDIWEAADAVRMMETTGCDGVVVGRGCLGRPWLFGNLRTVLSGATDPGHPDLGVVASTMRRHACLMAEDLGETRGVTEIRKHIAWYLKGFAVGPALRQSLALVSTLTELDDLLGDLDVSQQFPRELVGAPRGRTGAARRVVLPAGWLDDVCEGEVELDTPGAEAVSGG